MSPSSSRSDSPYGGLLGSLPADHEVDKSISDRALMTAMLRSEAALAQAQASVGLIPDTSARVIVDVAGRVDYDPGELGAAAADSGNPVVPLASWLTRDVREQDSAAAVHVHFGTTSQDIFDTALMLTSRAAVTTILERLDACADTAATLARKHARTLMTGRSLGQIAAPITFGAKAAGWLAGLDAATARLTHARDRLAVQLGGPVGTRAAWGTQAEQLAVRFAEEVGLVAAVPWHTERSRIVDLAGALGQAVAACGTVATDVVLLSQNEVAELAEGAKPGRGISSAMPHKHNPIGSVLVRAAALQTPGLVSTLLAAAVQDGERATGAWHAEWSPLRELLHLAGGATAVLADVLANLSVHPDVMRENVMSRGSVMFAESVSRALTGDLDRSEAQSIVANAAAKATAHSRPLREVLADDSRVTVHLTPAELDAAFDPARHIEAAARLVDQALRERPAQ